MNLQEIIDLELLQKVQDSYAEATGLAAITVDFRGNPITNYSNFSHFCNKIRKNGEIHQQCLKCDAFGGLEAARRENFFMYRCHAGLVDIAIPIIIKGQLIGSMLIGQVKLGENDNESLEYIVNESSLWKENEEIVNEYSNIPVLSYEKISAAAEMMFYVINNMVEKDVVQYAQQELIAKDRQLIEQMKVQSQLKKELSDKQNHSFQLLINPNFLFNTMNTLSCLAILEKATKTQDVISTLSEILKNLLTNNKRFVTIEEEISFIDQYVKLQMLRFEDRMQVFISIPEEFRSIKIPPMIVQSLVDNAIIHGIEPKDGLGSVKVTGYSVDCNLVIEVMDDGVGIPADKISRILEHKAIPPVPEQEKQLKGMGLHNVNSILVSQYGHDYGLNIIQNDLGGTTVKLKIPNDLDGRIS